MILIMTFEIIRLASAIQSGALALLEKLPEEVTRNSNITFICDFTVNSYDLFPIHISESTVETEIGENITNLMISLAHLNHQNHHSRDGLFIFTGTVKRVSLNLDIEFHLKETKTVGSKIGKDFSHYMNTYAFARCTINFLTGKIESVEIHKIEE